MKRTPIRTFVKGIFTYWRSMLLVLIAAVLAAVITALVYNYTRNLLIERLRERITAIASTAAVQLDPQDVRSVRTVDDVTSPEYERLVRQLKHMLLANNDVTFMYIMRRTDDINTMEFVADAFALDTLEELDVNKNGIIDEDEEIPLPGEEYLIEEESSALRDEAFSHPVAEYQITTDQWATLLAGYAPIRDDNGDVVGIVGLDVEVADYLRLTQATLLPFLLLIAFFIALLSLLTVTLVRIWNEKVEAVKELDRQKDEVLSMVSHQLATPITAIKWYLEMIIDDTTKKFSKEDKETLASMQSITGDLTDLVGMILDVSRIQLGKMKVDAQDLDLESFFKEVTTVILPKAKSAEVKFIQSLPKSLPTVKLDKRLTRMTLENLLSNAVKYTPKGGEVELKVVMKKDTIQCTVRDTGCGIPQADQKQIFGKLFRASNVRNTVEGNGFGLYVAKGAVEGQGGTIRFVSTEGKGTTFYIELPLVSGGKNKVLR